jgi:3-phenylpropionate/trans-cinnamate dioxygenase ferredoxin reductase component
MTAPRHIVLVGAGLAAQRCCQALRRRGHDGAITLIGDEAVLPYDRPPLSKEHLAGAMDDDALALRPRGWYDDHGVELELGDAAVALDPAASRIRLASGAAVAYDRVLLATGARPVALPGTQAFENVHVLRSADHAAALRERLRPGARLVIAGAGFIGQEVAATARALGVEVTMVEPAPTPLYGPLGPELGAWFADLHRQEGVDLRLGVRIERFRGSGARLDAVRLDDGTELECDALLAGIGVRPETGWLASSGLPEAVVAVDSSGATTVPGVFAAGDVAGGVHWEAAVAQGIAAAHGMLGLEPPAQPRPSFWSDQYGTRIQFVGDARGADRLELDGEPETRDFTALFLRDGVVCAGLLAGRPRALPALRDQLDQPLTDRRTA